MEGTTLKTTTSDRNPRRSRTKSLLGILVATALLAGATQALAPASASAMINMEQFLCALEGKTWDEDKGECNRSGNDDVGGGSTGGGWNNGPGGGSGSTGGSAEDPSSDPVGAANLPGPPAADRTPVIVIPVIDAASGTKYEAIAFPVGRNGLPLMGQSNRSSGASPRKANGRHRGRGAIGRRDSSRDDD
jgi:hypothetical protein